METLPAYIPQDRLRAIAAGLALPDRVAGSALFADISGYSALTEALVQALGPRRGLEELTRQINSVYEALIAEVDRQGGSVISFAGDAITCWFDGEAVFAADRAVSCALAMQRAIARVAVREGPAGAVPITMKSAVASGSARRLIVGDPAAQLIDVLAGAPIDRAAAGERLARSGDVLADEATIATLTATHAIGEWRGEGEARFALVTALDAPPPPPPSPHPAEPDPEALRPWLLRPVYERLRAGQGAFLAELRPATALFVSFGGIDYAAGDAGARLDAFIRWAQRVVDSYEGTILQITMGDKGGYFYAAFGAPLAHDDDPARAVAAALDLLAPPPTAGAVEELRAGVSQGRMRVGAYGAPARATYGVLGEEVNMAARLMSKAPPGRVLVSQAVADAVAPLFRLGLVGRLPVKGRPEGLALSAVLGRRPIGISRIGRPFGAALVGRDAELARVDALLARSAAGAGAVLHLQGLAGVGKSALAAACVERAHRRGVRVADGACQSLGRRRLYEPWSQIFRELLGLTAVEGLPFDEIVAHVELVLTVANPAWAVRVPLLGDLLDLPIADNPTTATFEPQARREALFALAADLIAGWAQAQPLLLLIDDVHLLDEASAGLVLALARVISSLACTLVLIGRPPAREERPLPAELDELPVTELMALPELSAGAVDELVSGRLLGQVGRLPLALIHSLAQGNPFYSEELVDMLRETGALARDDSGVWQLAAPVVGALRAARCLARDDAGEWRLLPTAPLAEAGLSLPVTVQGAVLARIDRLPEAHRFTLKVASVIGRVFELLVLRRAHPANPPPGALLAEIGLLEQRDFTRVELPPDEAYAFKHSITQEVVYDTLLEAQQRALHGAAAAVLEELHPDALELLAFHYRRAGVREKALTYLGRAAEAARAEYANETALSYYAEALALEERWEWRRGQAEVLHLLGRREEERAALELLERARGAPPVEVALLWGRYHEAMGVYGEARAAAERALGAVGAGGDEVARARCLAQLGLIARRQGDYEASKARYREALALFADEHGAGDAAKQALTQALNGLGAVLREQGDYAEARICYERAMALSSIAGDRRGEADALNSIGSIAFYERNFAEAMVYHNATLAIRSAIGERSGEGTSLYNLALVAQELGDYSRALSSLNRALEVQQAVGNRWEESNIWNGLGVVYQDLGLLREAERCFSEGRAVCAAIGDEVGEAYILANLGQVRCDLGDWAGGLELLARGRALALAQEDTRAVSYFDSHTAALRLEQGEAALAAELAAATLEQRRAADMHVWAIADLATLAAARLALGEREAARALAAEARALLDGGGSEGAEKPQRDYFVCCQVFAALGDGAAAAAMLASARAIVLARAEKILDPQLRRSYLENVAVNRLILAAGPTG